jgi:uncharacterized membrane protein YbjE (DUF340 family)
MTFIFLALVTGTLLGYLLRRHSRIHELGSHVTTLSIYVLLFLLGLSVGTDEAITRSLYQLGLEALALSLAGLSGSVCLAWVLSRWLFKGKPLEE